MQTFNNLLDTIREGLEKNVKYTPDYADVCGWANEVSQRQVGCIAESEYTTTFDGTEITAYYYDGDTQIACDDEELAESIYEELYTFKIAA